VVIAIVLQYSTAILSTPRYFRDPYATDDFIGAETDLHTAMGRNHTLSDFGKCCSQYSLVRWLMKDGECIQDMPLIHKRVVEEKSQSLYNGAPSI
jgi:hypothetical protein